MSWPSKDPDRYMGRGSFGLGWLLPAVVAAVAGLLAVALSDLVAGITGLVLGAAALLVPFPVLRRGGRSSVVAASTVVLAVVLAVALITVALRPLLDHVGDARRWG